MQRPFRQVDVFSSEPFQGNPVAVVLDADDLSAAQMHRIARWTNLSETTFVLRPTVDGADYQVRIFTPSVELPFAGHPTLGTCHAWLEAKQAASDPGSSAARGDSGPSGQSDVVIQQCGAGLIEIRRTPDGLGFAAPPLVRSGPVEDDLLERVAAQLGIDRGAIIDAQWADNGPGWIAVLLADVESVLALRPAAMDMDIGIAAPYPAGSECAFEVRAFFPVDGIPIEDPVTGSFNASLAQWLLASGLATAPYVASQGTAIGRRGRVHISLDDQRTVWVAGATTTRIAGVVDIS